MKKRSGLAFIFVILLVVLLVGFVNAVTYGSGTYGTGSFGSGEEEAAAETPSGGGGGGCSYDWECTDWFPEICPVDGVQERLCVNYGTCAGTIGMPEQNRTCVYEHGEPLFDISLTLPEESKEICSGRKINANINLENYGKIELLDAFMTYWIVDENNKLIAEVKDTRSVVEEINFDMSIRIPSSTPVGAYRLYSQITYSGNKTALAGESFEVVDNDSCKLISNISAYLPPIIIGGGFLVLFVLIVILFVKLHHYLKKKELSQGRVLESLKTVKNYGKGRKLLRALIRQKRRAEKENKILQGKRQREHKKHLREYQRYQKKIEKHYRKKVRKEKRTEKGGNRMKIGKFVLSLENEADK